MKNMENVSFQRMIRCACALVCALLIGSALISAQAPVPDSAEIEAKAHDMLSKLTLEEKIEMIGGINDMFTHAEPSAGLPSFKMSDSSAGVRTYGPSGYPANN